MITIEGNTLHFSGTFTYLDMGKIAPIVAEILKTDYSEIILNLTDLTFIDSTGIGALVIIQTKIIEQNKKLLVKGIKGQVQRVFKYANLQSIFTITE